MKVRINPYLVLVLGAIPDIDLILMSYGIQHRTLTHSLLFWSVVFIPVFIKYRKRSIPYFGAIIQHILLGDFIVNKTSLFWPLSDLELGLRFNLLSIENITLEALGLAIFLIWVNRNGDNKIFYSIQKRSLLSIIVLVPLIGFLLFLYQNSFFLTILMEHGMQIGIMEKIGGWIIRSSFFPLVTIMHLILASFLSIPLIQGSRAVLCKTVENRNPI